MHYIKKLSLLVLFIVSAVALQAQSTDEFNLDKAYHIDTNGTIFLSSDDADVTIIGSDRSDVHLTVHYKLQVKGFTIGKHDKFDMNVRETGGDLVLKEKERDFSGVTFGSTSEKYTIRIEVPRGVSLNFNGDDEQYNIRDVDGRIAVDADDAQAKLTGCRGDDFMFDLDDGYIRMDQGRGALRIDVDDGQAEIRNADFSSVDVSADDGKFSIGTALRDDGSYHFDMDDGDIELSMLKGGGLFSIHHDDADISVDSAFRLISDKDDEEEARYELAGGSANVYLDVDDTNIELRKGH